MSLISPAGLVLVGIRTGAASGWITTSSPFAVTSVTGCGVRLMMLVMRTSKGVVAVPILAWLVVRGKWWRKCRRVCSPPLPRGPLEQRGSLLHLHPHRRGVFVIPHGVRADVDDVDTPHFRTLLSVSVPDLLGLQHVLSEVSDQLLQEVARGGSGVLRGRGQPQSDGGGNAGQSGNDTSGEGGEEDGHRVSFLLVCLTDTSTIAHCSALRKQWEKKNPPGENPGVVSVAARLLCTRTVAQPVQQAVDVRSRVYAHERAECRFYPLTLDSDAGGTALVAPQIAWW